MDWLVDILFLLWDFVGEWVVVLVGGGILLLGAWVWNKVRPKTKKIVSPYPSLTNHNGGELVFLEWYKIKKIDSVPVPNYSLGKAKSGTITIPIGMHTIVFDTTKKISMENITWNEVKDFSAYGRIEAGKKHVIKSMLDTKTKIMDSSFVLVDDVELKNYLAGDGFDSIINKKTLDKLIEPADSLSSQKKHDEAIAKYTEALRIFPHTLTYNKRGLTYFIKGEFENAIKDFSMAISIYQNNAVFYANRGAAYYYMKDYVSARSDYDKAIQLNPNDAICYLFHGYTCHYLNELDKAKESYTKALQINPNYTEASDALKILNIVNQQPEKTTQFVDADAAYKSGEAHLKNGKYDNAIADYTEAIRLNPNSVDAYIERGIAYRTKRISDKALADFTEAIRLNPNSVDAHVHRGIAYHIKEDYGQAIADLTEAIRLNPGYAFAYYRRGMVFHSKKDCDQAIADFTEAIRLNPNYALAYYDRGKTYHKEGDFDRAIADYERALQINPDNIFAKGDLNKITLQTSPEVISPQVSITSHHAAEPVSIANEARVLIHGYPVRFVQPLRVVQEILLAPILPIAVSVDQKFDWDGKTVTIVSNDIIVLASVGKINVVVRNKKTSEERIVTLPVSPRVYDGIPFFPVEAIARALGINVTWVDTNTINLIIPFEW